MKTISYIKSREIVRSESGIVSLLITMILMIVISLIVLGFAQIARRTQNQQLNNSLSSQAYYAAESGVNDVANVISANPGANYTKSTCTNTSIYSGLTALEELNAPQDTISYTCVTVNPYVQSINLSIGSTSYVVPLNPVSGSPPVPTNLTSVTLTWEVPGVAHPFSSCPTKTEPAANEFSPSNSAAWTCGYGVVRVDLVPTAGGGNTQQSLELGDLTTFLQPDKTGPLARDIAWPGNPVSTKNNDNVYGVRCYTAGNDHCTVTFSGLNFSQMYMRVSSIYKDMTLQITANNGSGPVQLKGAQIVVDSTGKSQDTLRRIQVALPVGVQQNALPDNAMESTNSICKQFAVMTNYYSTLMPAGTSGSGPICTSNTVHP